MKERTIVVDGFSKSYSMTGWRLGYGLLPDSLVETFDLYNVNIGVLRLHVWAARRPRRADRHAGPSPRDGRRVPTAARLPGRGVGGAFRDPLRDARRRVLRVSEHYRDWLRLPLPRSEAPRRRRGRRARREFVWPGGRRVLTIVVRELDRESAARGRTHPRVPSCRSNLFPQ